MPLPTRIAIHACCAFVLCHLSPLRSPQFLMNLNEAVLGGLYEDAHQAARRAAAARERDLAIWERRRKKGGPCAWIDWRCSWLVSIDRLVVHPVWIGCNTQALKQREGQGVSRSCYQRCVPPPFAG